MALPPPGENTSGTFLGVACVAGATTVGAWLSGKIVMGTVFVAVTPGTGLPMLSSSWLVMVSVVGPLKKGAGRKLRCVRAAFTAFTLPWKVIIAVPLLPAVNVSPVVLPSVSVTVTGVTDSVTCIQSVGLGA